MQCDTGEINRFLDEMRRTLEDLTEDGWKSLRLRYQALGRLEMGLLVLEIVKCEPSDKPKLARLQRTLAKSRKDLDEYIQQTAAQDLFKKIEWRLREKMKVLHSDSQAEEEGE